MVENVDAAGDLEIASIIADFGEQREGRAIGAAVNLDVELLQARGERVEQERLRECVGGDDLVGDVRTGDADGERRIEETFRRKVC